MTTVAQIIQDAFRASNLVATGASPTSDEQTEALRLLNRLVKSTIGNEAGEDFTNLPLGSEDVSRPSDHIWYDGNPGNDWFVPKNVRIVANLNEALSLYLHPEPNDGTRFAIVDIQQNFSTNPVTVYGNGRRINGQESVVLDTDGENSEWFYRADLGDWLPYASLNVEATFPFPEEFDEYFILSLAMRVNPLYGTSIDPQLSAMLARSRSQLRARYEQKIFVPSELSLLRMAKTPSNQGVWQDHYGPYDSSVVFEKGWLF